MLIVCIYVSCDDCSFSCINVYNKSIKSYTKFEKIFDEHTLKTCAIHMIWQSEPFSRKTSLNNKITIYIYCQC